MNLFRSDFDHLFTLGFSVLSILIHFGGVCACVMFRRLSRWMMMAASGFAGLMTSRLLPFVTAIFFRRGVQVRHLVDDTITAVSLLSELLLVFGLGLALIQIRRQIALALEPNHGRR